ncbi:MAG: phage tail protein, partial [Acidobacteriales bacterium]|nr:phage tail protein [Terriglobales bacterium]
MDGQPDNSLTLTTVLNPWEPQTQREVRLVLHAPGKTVAEYLRAANITRAEGIDLACSWNGRVLTDAECARLAPRPGDCIAITARPHGGGGGGGKNVIGTIAMIALVIVATVATAGWGLGLGAMLGGALGVSETVGSAIVFGSIMMGGSLLINAIMPGPKMESGAANLNWGESSPSYGWDRSANLMREGLAIPVIYGTMLLTPPVIAANVQAAADGSEYLNVLYALGEGPLSIELDADYNDMLAVYLNDQHHSVFARTLTQQSSKVKLNGTATASSRGVLTFPDENGMTSSWAAALPQYAADGATDNTRYWIKATADGSPWWTLDLGASVSQAANAYLICCGDGSWSWTLAGSNDNSSWTTLDTRSGQSCTTLTRYTFTNTTAYRYYRLSGLNQIIEVELYTEDTGSTSGTLAITARDGTNNQGLIPQFCDTYSMEAGWSSVKMTTDYVERELTGTAIAGIVVGISFPYGLYTIDAAGNKSETSVEITLQFCTYSGGWGAWTDWGPFTVSGAKVGAYKWTRELSNLTAGRYKVRAKFASEPSNGTNYVNTAYWEFAQTIIPDDFTYPNTALLGLRALATDQLSGGLPRVTAKVTRNIVTVDVSGTPTDKSASNPAWAAYDILANTRYGAGVDTDDLIYAEFAAWAAYCEDPDDLDSWDDATAYVVGDRILPTSPAGYCYRCTTAGTSGGTEPTWPTVDGDTVTDNGVVWTCEDYGYRVDIVFDSATSIVAALSDLAVAGHGIVVQRGSQYGVIIDQPASPTQMFGMGNVVKDSFKIDYLNLEDRANVVEITYWDRDRNYQRTTIEVRSSGFDAGTDAERNAPAVTLYGCTSRRTAIKYGRYMLRQNALVTHTISFEAGVDAIAVLPGDVFKFSHDVPQWQYSGRIAAITPTNGESVTSITLDQTIYCEAAKSYQIQIRESNTSDALVTLSLTAVEENGSYATFALTAPATGKILPEDVYIFGETTETTQLYRVLSISRAQDQTRKITAALYSATAYDD